MSAQGRGGDAGLLDDELGSKRTRDGAVRSCGDGHLHGQAPIPRKQISLPPAPHHGVAPAHQKAVARVLGGARIVGGRGIVEELQRALVAAVVDVVEQPPVAAAHVHGLDDEELRGILHQAAVVGRRQRQVHDVLVGGLARVDGEPHPSLDPFVGSDRAEVGPFGKGRTFLDDQGGVHELPRDRFLVPACLGEWARVRSLGQRRWSCQLSRRLPAKAMTNDTPIRITESAYATPTPPSWY